MRQPNIGQVDRLGSQQFLPSRVGPHAEIASKAGAQRFHGVANRHHFEALDGLEVQHVAAGMKVSQTDDGDLEPTDHANVSLKRSDLFFGNRDYLGGTGLPLSSSAAQMAERAS